MTQTLVVDITINDNHPRIDLEKYHDPCNLSNNNSSTIEIEKTVVIHKSHILSFYFLFFFLTRIIEDEMSWFWGRWYPHVASSDQFGHDSLLIMWVTIDFNINKRYIGEKGNMERFWRAEVSWWMSWRSCGNVRGGRQCSSMGVLGMEVKMMGQQRQNKSCNWFIM